MFTYPLTLVSADTLKKSLFHSFFVTVNISFTHISLLTLYKGKSLKQTCISSTELQITVGHWTLDGWGGSFSGTLVMGRCK